MLEGEAERVQEQVTGRLQDLGFTPEQALALFLAGVDWHQVERAVAAGCTLELAVQIFG